MTKQKRPLRTSLEWLIEKGNAKFNYKFDYSKVDYKGVKEKVEIICPEHGSFWQTPDQHIYTSKRGCRKCAGNKRRNTAEFIEEASQYHNGFYDYSLVEYKTLNEDVKIICPLHGEFKQRPVVHLRSGGCRKCSNTAPKTLDDFLKEASERHGDRFDYSLVQEINTYRIDIPIVCREHGVFYQQPEYHLRYDHCCPGCVSSFKSKGRRGNKEEFVNKSIQVHGNSNFDYSEVEYIKNNIKVKITCKYGHEFWQTPANHITGFGCPDCASGWVSHGFYQTDNESNLYVISLKGEYIKVGLSKNVESRMKSIEKDSGMVADLIKTTTGPANTLFDLEQKILRKSGFKLTRPPEKFAGYTECLSTESLGGVLNLIKQYEENPS